MVAELWVLIMNEYVILIFSYLLGSVPTGLVLGKFFFNLDIRKKGSKNIGATNVWRVGGKKIGIITLILDIFKGAVPVLVAKHFLSDLYVWAGCLAVIGHVFPVWLKFKGGKGVATFVGAILAFNPIIGILTAAFWAVIFKLSKVSSISSLMSLTASSLYLAIVDFDDYDMLLILFVLAIIIFRHYQNIIRLWQGKEQIFK
jgi:glycerol-3-phosphate acyltransferase PlsY